MSVMRSARRATSDEAFTSYLLDRELERDLAEQRQEESLARRERGGVAPRREARELGRDRREVRPDLAARRSS